MQSMVFGPRSGGKHILPLSQSPGSQEMERQSQTLGLTSQRGALHSQWGPERSKSHSTFLCRGNRKQMFTSYTQDRLS